jgi:molybdenum-dependent DNA-binding transcriptional regulator ModE
MRKEIGNSGKADLHGRTASLDWESLRTVLAVTRAKSLAGAARALDLQHSTVYRRIEEVERRLGQPLFDRNRGGWTANALGETAAGAAEAMELAALEAERRLLGADAGSKARSASRRPSSSAAICSRGSCRRSWPNIPPWKSSWTSPTATPISPVARPTSRFARRSRRRNRSWGASSSRSPTRSTWRHRS